MSKKAVGQVFRTWREAAGMTIDQASDMLSIPRSTLSGIEHGKHYPGLASTLAILQHVSLHKIERAYHTNHDD